MPFVYVTVNVFLTCCVFVQQFIRLAQTLKYYGYIKFDPCITDFPEKGCHVIVGAGNNELNFHVKLPNEQMKEGSFKVTRMRCWRVTSSVSLLLIKLLFQVPYVWFGPTIKVKNCSNMLFKSHLATSVYILQYGKNLDKPPFGSLLRICLL